MVSNQPFSNLFKRSCHKWVKPTGFDTGIKIFNCITKSKQPLIIKNKNLVSWYTCGPTVYDSSHLGHASCYVKLDIIQRILKNYFKLNLVTVMNITDVDDKIIARANALQVPPQHLTKKYEKEFWRDLQLLGINKPDSVLRVTEKIEVIRAFIEELLHEERAYLGGDGSVYFDTKTCQNYGKLQNITEEETATSRFKKSSMDFALWKSCKPGEIFWESSWGLGRPGWHIECSALATHIFGSEIDIHAGGVDLRFPHHENEEAQSCAFHNKCQWVNYWVHTGHLHTKNCEKMSKSLKNTISINEMLETTSSEVFRTACIMSHYRSNMEFTPEFMETANNLHKSYTNFINNCQNYNNGYINVEINNLVLDAAISKCVKSIHEALLDDFNTPKIVKILTELVTQVNGMLHTAKTNQNHTKSPQVTAASNIVKNTLNSFGLVPSNLQLKPQHDNFGDVMDILNNFRQEIRVLGINNKDQNVIRLCDNVRKELKHSGIVIKDHGKLSSWSS